MIVRERYRGVVPGSFAAAALTAAVFAVPAASAATIALSPNTNTGHQSYDDLAGEDFSTTKTILVSQLGVYDNGGDGVLKTDSPTQPVVAQLWNTDTGVAVATVNFGGGNSIGTDTSVGSGKVFFQSVGGTPLVLQAGGHYDISVDYSGQEGFANKGAGDPVPTINTGGGAVSFPATNGGRGSGVHGAIYGGSGASAPFTSSGFFDSSQTPYTLGDFQFSALSTEAPITGISGWNKAVVRASNSGTLNGFDGNQNHNLVVQGVEGATAGLPASGAITMTKTGDQFQLQDYSGNDSAQWTGGSANGGVSNANVTLLFGTPASYSSVAFLASSGGGGNGAYTGTVTLNFVGGSSTTYTSGLNTPDWVAAGADSLSQNAPVSHLSFDANGSSNNSSTQVGLAETTIALSASDQNLLLQSVTFSGGTLNSGTGAIDNVLAVSGVSVPEPAMLGLIGLGATMLLARRRRI